MSRLRVLFFALFSLVLFNRHSLQAQTPPTFPPCFEGLINGTVGVPYYCDYGTALNQFLTPYFQDSGVSVLFTFNVTAGSTLPAGLSLTPSGVLSGTPTTTGNYSFSMDITLTITFQGQSFSETIPFPTELKVDSTAGGKTLVEPGGLVFSANQTTTTGSQSINLFSRQSAPITYTAAATTTTGGGWLSVTTSGTVNPFQSTTATASVNAAGLSSGTYFGNIAFALSTGENYNVPVLLAVTANQQSIVLSQTGVYFQAVQGGSSPPAQSLSVLNGGSGNLSYSVAANTLSGGSWLSVSTPSGTATSSTSGSIGITVNSTGMAPGTYYGQIQVSATGVTNSPQTATVVLSVVTPAQNPGPTLNVTGLVLVQAGATVNSTKSLSVSNPSPNPVNFSASGSADAGKAFFTVSPASGTLTSAQPVAFNVQPVAGLSAGVYTGNLTLIFTDASTQTVYQRRVGIALIVVPGVAGSARTGSLLPHAASCSPTKLILVATQLGSSFTVPAAWPAPLEVTAVDDCGSFMTQGTVTSSFSNGDPPLILGSQQDGRWSGTWVPRSTISSDVTITVNARETAPALTGTTQLGGTLSKNPAVPVITAGGVVSAASYTQRQPLAPGSYIAIFGQNLNISEVAAQSLPLKTQLGGAQVLLGGKALPLNYAGAGQINALVPFDTPINTTQQLIVQQTGQLSAPEPVVISGTQPAIFVQGDNTYGVIRAYKADGSSNFVIDASHPVSAGDVLVIYCTGLGPVDQPVAAGSAGPSSPLANTLNTVTATIGGQNATVVFAGLAPTLTVYQVNLVVPPGVTPGKTVPIVLSQSGQQSVPVQIAVQ